MMSDKQEDELKKLRNFLIKIQLDNFSSKLVGDLHILKIDHFDYVEESDLVRIGMSLPDIRRLLDQAKTYRKSSFNTVYRVKKALGLASQNPVSKDTKMKELRGYTEISDTNKCIINEQDIVLNESLGKGAFGVVHKAQWKSGKESRSVAVKSLQIGTELDLQQLIHDLMMEAKTMMTLHHPNLIELYGITVTPPMMLVTELAPLGSLLMCLRNEPHRFLISTLSSFLVQIVAGMKYLEEKGFVHRDLAARNCLLMTYEKVKIGDFGLSRPLRIDENFYVMQPEAKIPTAWCAPECLEFKRFSHASDIWAFGVTAFEIFSLGAQPWPTLTANEIFERITEPNCEKLARPQNCSKNLYDVLKNTCWALDPGDRGTFKRLERHIIDCLPHELKASFSNEHGEPNDNLQFVDGDLITAFDFSNGVSWKCQNRRTQQIGFVPKNFVNLKSGKIEVTSGESQHRRRYASEGDIHSKNQSQEGFPQRKSFDSKFEKKYFSFRRSSRTIEQDSSGSGYESTDSSSIGKRKDSEGYNYSLSSTDSGCRCSSQYSTDSIYTEIESTYSQPMNIPLCKKNDSINFTPSPFSSHSLNVSPATSSPVDNTSSRIYASPSSLPSNQWQFHQVVKEDFPGKHYVQMDLLEKSENKNPLPDVVNLKKKTSQFSRRRSLPRLKSKLASKLDEKRFSFTPSPPSSTPPKGTLLDDNMHSLQSSRPKSLPMFSPLNQQKASSSWHEQSSNSQWYDEIPIRTSEKKIVDDELYENVDLITANSTNPFDNKPEPEPNNKKPISPGISKYSSSDSNIYDNSNNEKKPFFVSESELQSPRYENVISEGSLFKEINAELTLSNLSSMLKNTDMSDHLPTRDQDGQHEEKMRH